MKSLFNLNNKINNRLLNKGYFSSINKKIIFNVYMMIRNEFKKKLGRKCKVSLLEQIVITLFKLRYNLPDRIMEDLYYCVDSTVLRIGKGKSKDTYSGYKHHHGVKFQLTINNENIIKHVSKSYSSSTHDKKLFIAEYKDLCTKINEKLTIIGDKGYSGLKELKLEIPIKRNEIKYKENKDLSKSNNKSLSGKRIKIEHVFAYIKSYRIMQRLNYYSKQRIEILFNSIVNIYNLQQLFKI